MTGVVLAGLLAPLGGCQPGTPDDGSASTPVPTPPPTASAESMRTYRIPDWQRICATVQGAGITVNQADKDADTPGFQEACRIDTGGATQIASATVTFEVSRIAEESFQRRRNDDWTKGFAFSGPARDKETLRQIGGASEGRDYDEAYYAFFPEVRVAGTTNSTTKVVVRRGNALISFSVDGAEWHGPKPATVEGLEPLPPEFGRSVVDQLAAPMLALLEPDV